MARPKNRWLAVATAAIVVAGLGYVLWQFLPVNGPSPEDPIEALLREIEDFEFVHQIERHGDVLRIDGHIHEGLYKDIRKFSENYPIRRMLVSSPGGEVMAGIKIGLLIWENEIEIEVDGECVSSCANYLFAAAPKKIIRDDSAVIWHGNLSQRDFREFWQCDQTVSVISGWPIATRERIAELLYDDEERATWFEIKERERAFFSRIGVDEFVARVGQEPKFYGDFTMTVADMALFGITGVEAVEDYGTAAFCERFNEAQNDWHLHCIEVGAEALAFEEARRKYGEICTADAHLVINFPDGPTVPYPDY